MLGRLFLIFLLFLNYSKLAENCFKISWGSHSIVVSHGKTLFMSMFNTLFNDRTLVVVVYYYV